MDDLRLNCDGVICGSLVIPAFELRAGQLLSLQVPAPLDSRDRLLIQNLLCGVAPHPAIQLHSHVMAEGPIDGRRGFLTCFFAPSAENWLAKHAKTSVVEAEKAIRKLGTFEPSERVTRLPGTPRKILGLLAAWKRGAEAIIYTTSGLDPAGCEFVHRLVGERLQECPALHLAYPYVSDGARSYDCPPGAIVIRAEHAEHIAGPA